MKTNWCFKLLSILYKTESDIKDKKTKTQYKCMTDPLLSSADIFTVPVIYCFLKLNSEICKMHSIYIIIIVQWYQSNNSDSLTWE